MKTRFGRVLVRTLWIATITVLSGRAAVEIAANEPLTIRVDPPVSYAPADLRVQLGVMPSADNSRLVVVADSAGFYRSSEMPLDAEDAPRTVIVQFRGLPGGVYTVWGEVTDAGGRRLAVARREVTILPLAGNQ